MTHVSESMFVGGKSTARFGVLARDTVVSLTLLLVASTSAVGAQKRKIGLQADDFKIRPSVLSIGLNIIGGYLAGNEVTTLLQTDKRFLFGGGAYVEYRLSRIVRCNAGIDGIFGQFFEHGARGRGWSYSAGVRLVHQPEARSSLSLSGSLGMVMLGEGSKYETREGIDRSCLFGRLGIGQSYYVTPSNLTLVEFMVTGIKTNDGNAHPYVGLIDENVYYLMLRISWLFGL
jgi:hypothetical protein